MILQKISFEHFYMEVIDYIDPAYARMLNPYIMTYFKCGNIYLALTLSDVLTINFAIKTGKSPKSDKNWVDILINECKKVKVDKISFITSINNKIVRNIAEKYGCKTLKVEEGYYPDGSDAIIYEGKVNKDT